MNNDYGSGTGDLANQGTKNGNLFGGANGENFFNTVDFNFTEGKIKDNAFGDKTKVNFRLDLMGHRWWGLDPTSTTTGIAIANNNKITKAVYMVYGTGVVAATPSIEFSAFPNGYFPIQADMRKYYNKGEFPNRNAVPESEYFQPNHYTVWSIQYFRAGKNPRTLTANKNINLTIRKNYEKGEIVHTASTTLNKEPAGLKTEEDGSVFVVKKNDGFKGVIVIKPKHGIISDAYNKVKGKNALKIFHITIDGEGIDIPISYRIMYMDLKYFDINSFQIIE